MCPRLTEQWRADEKRKRRVHIFGPLAWYVGVVMSAVAVGFFCAAFLVILFRWGGAGAWSIVGVMLAVAGFVVVVPVAIDRLTRGSRRRRELRGHPRP